MGAAIFRNMAFIIMAFLLGMVSHSVMSDLNIEQPAEVISSASGIELESPSDWISEGQIHVYKDRIVLEIPNAVWARFTDTNSMDPVIDEHSNGLEVVPSSENDIKIGDIVAYESEYSSGTIIHRIVEKGVDEQGTYFIAKGDNNEDPDPGRIRFNQIKRVLVGIIY